MDHFSWRPGIDSCGHYQPSASRKLGETYHRKCNGRFKWCSRFARRYCISKQTRVFSGHHALPNCTCDTGLRDRPSQYHPKVRPGLQDEIQRADEELSGLGLRVHASWKQQLAKEESRNARGAATVHVQEPGKDLIQCRRPSADACADERDVQGKRRGSHWKWWEAP